MGVHVFPILKSSPNLPPHPIPLGHASAPALSALAHASNLHWRSISHMIIRHMTMLFSQIIPPSPSPTESKSLVLLVAVVFHKKEKIFYL